MHTYSLPSSGEMGRLFDPFNAAYQANPESFYTVARQSEPVFFSPLLSTWVVTRYEDIRAILADPRLFSSAGTTETIANYPPEFEALLKSTDHRILATALPNIDPPHHTRIRSSISRLFAAAQIARYEPSIRSEASPLLIKKEIMVRSTLSSVFPRASQYRLFFE